MCTIVQTTYLLFYLFFVFCLILLIILFFFIYFSYILLFGVHSFVFCTVQLTQTNSRKKTHIFVFDMCSLFFIAALLSI